MLTIRKFVGLRKRLSDLVRAGTLSQPMADLLEFAVGARCNILVAGGTGAGKTTFLNVLAGLITEDQRLITIEDTLELQVSHPNVVAMECRTVNVEGRGELTVRDLLRNSLRMRPDRILVGEVRGPEAYDMLQAMSTGHDGGMSTIHANSAHDAVLRFESLAVAGSPSLPPGAVRDQIAGSLDLVVHLARLDVGRRVVTSIAELRDSGASALSLVPLFELAPETREFREVAPPQRTLLKARIHGAPIPQRYLGVKHVVGSHLAAAAAS